jgi:hypothetical protein
MAWSHLALALFFGLAVALWAYLERYVPKDPTSLLGLVWITVFVWQVWPSVGVACAGVLLGASGEEEISWTRRRLATVLLCLVVWDAFNVWAPWGPAHILLNQPQSAVVVINRFCAWGLGLGDIAISAACYRIGRDLGLSTWRTFIAISGGILTAILTRDHFHSAQPVMVFVAPAVLLVHGRDWLTRVATVTVQTRPFGLTSRAKIEGYSSRFRRRA